MLRVLGLIVLYSAVFMALAAAQFARKGHFSQQVGAMLISGQYRTPQAPGDGAAGAREIAGGLSVYFGGLEFRLENRNDGEGLFLLGANGERESVQAESMRISGDQARFTLSGGMELVFSSRYANGSYSLWMSVGGNGEQRIELPFKPQRTAAIHKTGSGQTGIAHNGIVYQFSRPPESGKDRRLIIAAGTPVSYYATTERQTFNPGNYISEPAKNRESFTDALARWNDQRFAWWKANIANQNDEDAVIAYAGEAIRRGSFRAALDGVSSEFISGDSRTWESSVYLGGMDEARRTFVAAEREKTARLSRLISAKSPDLLREEQLIEFLSVRGMVSLVDEAAESIRGMNGSALEPSQCAGVFEGHAAFSRWRPSAANPFDRLVEQALRIVSGDIRREAGLVFVFQDSPDAAPADAPPPPMAGVVPVEFNLRLGKALLDWAEKTGNADWAGIGRSIILSVLSLGDSTGAVPSTLGGSGGSAINTNSGANSDTISAARLYRILNMGEYRPRAAAAGSGVSGIWTWTSAAAVSAVQEHNVLDITVAFPAGESHYMMIRGVRSFSNVMLYNINYPTDPRFERYDSSGWAYFPQDQLLVLKMKHRNAEEHIRIVY
jgi:hypothetical protein